MIKECTNHFGKPLDKKLNLFEINKDFVLELTFADTEVAKFSITPKYFFREEHPEWSEPEKRPVLDVHDYRGLLKKFESLKPKGEIVNKEAVGTCSNGNCWFGEFYEDAFLEYAMRGEARIGSFFISYFSNVKGEIISKKTSKYATADGNKFVCTVRVLINDGDRSHIYYVRKDVYRKLKKGKTQTFQGAFVN